jgi:hypothetical protein
VASRQFRCGDRKGKYPMSSNTNPSDAEAERASTEKNSRKADLLNLKNIKRAFKIIIFGLKIWKLGAKLQEWFL